MRADAYVRFQREQNPLPDVLAIRAARRVFLGKSSSGRADPRDYTREDRETHQLRLATLRNGFWSLPRGRRETVIATLAESPFPEVAVSAEQLRNVNDCNDEFGRLAADRECDPVLARALMNIVVASPRCASRARLELIHHMAANSSTVGRAIRRSVERVRAIYPQIYQLESDWLTKILLLNLATTAGACRRLAIRWLYWAIFALAGLGVYLVIRNL